MAEIVYDIKKKYSELDSWISGLTEGTYNVEVDCSGVGPDQFYGFPGAAPFGNKLNKAKSGVKFNLKPININPEITNCGSLFQDCSKLTEIDTSAFKQVNNASYMFKGCTGLTTITGASAFTKVTDASYMFSNCYKLTTIDASAFKKVNNASSMFDGCTGLTTIDTSSFTQVNKANSMFSNCSKLTTIDTSAFTQVNNANRMFKDCTGLTTVIWGNIKPATNTDMFSGASAQKTIVVTDQETVDWIKANESIMQLTSYTAYINTYTKKYSELDAFIPTLIPGAYNLTVDCKDVPASEFKGIFDAEGMVTPSPLATKLTAKAQEGVLYNLKLINTPEIIDATAMFANCSGLTEIDTSAFTQVNNASGMFANCSGLTTIDTSAFTQVNNASWMFYGCSGLTTIDTSAFTQVNNASGMFSSCTGLTTIDTSAFTQVNNASGMFSSCTGLTTIDTSAFTQVTDASQMFLGCSGLTEIDTSAFTQVNNAFGMFGFCEGLTEIDTSAFTQVNNAYGMFLGCSGLTTVIWGNIKPATNTDMFSGASAQKTIAVADTETVDWITNNAESMKLTSYTAYINTFTKKYSELDAFIPTLVNKITYNLTVDCTGENDLSQFGTFLQKAKEGVFFNLIPTNVQAKDLNNIFKGTSSLKKIDTTNFENIENSNNMFENCIDLNNIIWGNNFTPNSITNMFTGCGTINVYANGWLSNEFVKTYANDMSLKYKFTNGSYEKPSVPENIDYSNIDNTFLLYFDSNTYNLNINCASAEPSQFIGSELSASPLANKLEKKGVYFNLTLSDIKPEVTDCSYMFFNFLGLEKISFAKSVQQRSLSNGISNANHMFDRCLNLKEVDTTPLTQVTTADGMFTDCSSLAEVTDNNGNVFTKGADCSTLSVKKVYTNRSVKEQIKDKFPASAKFLSKIIQRTYKVTDSKDSELSLNKDNRYINGNLIIDGTISSNEKDKIIDVSNGLSIKNNSSVIGNLRIEGNLDVTGTTTTTSTENITSKNNLITLREGTVTSIGEKSLSGVLINNYDGSNCNAIGSDYKGTFKVGKVTISKDEKGKINSITNTDEMLQIATIQNNPANFGIAYWDNNKLCNSEKATIKDGNITSTSLKINKSSITTNDAGDFIFSWS